MQEVYCFQVTSINLAAVAHRTLIKAIASYIDSVCIGIICFLTQRAQRETQRYAEFFE